MKIFLFVTFFIVSSFCLKPSVMAQIRVGPEAGVNFAMQTQTIGSDTANINPSQSSVLKVGALAGVNLDIRVLKKFYVQSGLFYAYDNVKFKNEIDFTGSNLGIAKEEMQNRIHYFKVPVYLMYKSGFDGSSRFIAGIGPYAGYAFAGNRLTNTPVLTNDINGKPVSYANVKTSRVMNLGDDADDDLRHWDYGINACIGFESNVGMYFRGSVNYGLQNLMPGAVSGQQLRNLGMGVSIGFNLGKDNW